MNAPPSLVARATSLIEATQRAAEAYGRVDLTDRLAQARERLTEPDLNALVVGEFKKGKSTLVNSLLNVPLCPVSDEVATVVPTYVRHGESAVAEIVAEAGRDGEGRGDPVAGQGPDGTGLGEDRATRLERRPIDVSEIPAWVSEQGNLDNTRNIRAVEVRVPRQLLASGLALVDTPGVGGLRSIHSAATMAALGTAEVVVFVTDASQELSALELEWLRTATDRCPTVVCVVTKTDLYPAWRRIVELNRGHLERSGLGEVPLVPVSSLLRQEALARSSKELNEESGYPVLLRYLNESVIGRSQQVAVRTALGSVRFVLDQLESTFEAERSVLADPERAQPLMDELVRARERAEQLRAQSARWQQTLGDGSQDLATEVEHDLRRRFREAVSVAEEVLDENEPLDIWDDFSAWFSREVAAHVAENAELLRRQATALAEQVAEHFALDEETVVHEVDVGVHRPIVGELEVDMERGPVGSGTLAALRGSYGGVLMFGMIGQVVGLALLNPLTAVLGIGLGRRALREERNRQVTMRRQQAKQAVRRYIDDVSFAINKDARDAIRRVQRELRDEFTQRAEQLQRSTREALSRAEEAARRTTEETRARLADVDAELARLAKVRRAADELAAACTTGASA